MRKIKTILFSLFTVVALTACDDKDLSKELPDPEEKVSDLNIPPDFNWKTTRTVTCNLVSETITRVRIYNEESCSEESLLALYTVTPDGENPLRLHLPTGLKTVYVKLGNEVFATDIEDFSINVNLPASLTSQNVPCVGCQKEDVIYFPCYGEQATMMFEDYFPEMGDYDFNDLVINYNYIITFEPKTKEMYSFDLNMTINALGGIYSIDPCFRLEGILTDYVNAISKYGDYTFEQYRDYDGDVCLVMKGLTDKPAGCEFLNTKTEETIVPYADVKTARFVIKFNTKEDEGRMVPKTYNLKAFNLFTECRDYEIHERAWPPSRKDYPDSYPGLGKEYYTTSKNLVWALTVPVKIKHAKERVDFLKAYPDFKEWAESGGKQGMNWYHNEVDENLFTIPGYLD